MDLKFLFSDHSRKVIVKMPHNLVNQSFLFIIIAVLVLVILVLILVHSVDDERQVLSNEVF